MSSETPTSCRTATRTTPPLHSSKLSSVDAPAPFTIEVFPDILQLVINLSDTSTLASLSQCSKSLAHLSLPPLYRHVRISQHQLANLIQAANSRPSRSDKAQDSRQPVMEGILSLHLADDDLESDSVRISDGIWTELPILVLNSRTQERDDHLETASFLAQLKGINIHKLYIRASEDCFVHVSNRYNRAFGFRMLPSSAVDITLLVPNSWRYNGLPYISAGNESSDPWMNRQITMVLFPWRLIDDISIHPVCLSDRNRQAFISNLIDDTEFYLSLRLVGPEYLDITAEHMEIAGSPHDTDTLKLMTFVDWLDEQEAGAIFTEEEEEELRKADLLLLEEVRKVRQKNESPF